MSIEKFYDWLQLNKDSKKTIKTYFQQVNCFGKWCDYKFTQENLDKYVIKLKEENKSPASINLFLISIKTYCTYKGIDLKQMIMPIPKKVKKRAIKLYFTEEDMEIVFKNITLISGDFQLKELILRFMFYTGARPSELMELKSEHINFDTKDVNFYNAKGNKDRTIPIMNTKLFNDLKNHCNNREKVFDVSYAQINYLVKGIKKLLKVDGVIEPRTLRISFAKHCLSKGMDIAYLKKLMGHSDIKITELYAEPDEKMIKDVCEKIRKGLLK